MVYRSCIFLLIGILASGCIGWTSISKVPERSEDFRSQVVIGQTSRNQVHARLGEPFISEKKIEVYRVLEDPDVTVILPGWETQEVILYALVAYDDNDIVDDIDWGIYPHEKENDPGRYMSVIRSARLQAGNFDFAVYNQVGWISRRQEILLAPPSVSAQAFAISPPPGMCSAIVFLKPMEDRSRYERQLYLDGKHLAELPLGSGYWTSGDGGPVFLERVFIKLLVTEDIHELKITASHSPGDFRRKFECRDRDVFYVYPRHRVVESEPWSVWKKQFRIDGDIEIYDKPIEAYDGWKRLLFYNGKWLGQD